MWFGFWSRVSHPTPKRITRGIRLELFYFQKKWNIFPRFINISGLRRNVSRWKVMWAPFFGIWMVSFTSLVIFRFPEFIIKTLSIICIFSIFLLEIYVFVPGLRMVVVIKDELFLYQHRSISYMSKVGTSAPVMFCIAEEVTLYAIVLVNERILSLQLVSFCKICSPQTFLLKNPFHRYSEMTKPKITEFKYFRIGEGGEFDKEEEKNVLIWSYYYQRVSSHFQITTISRMCVCYRSNQTTRRAGT